MSPALFLLPDPGIVRPTAGPGNNLEWPEPVGGVPTPCHSDWSRYGHMTQDSPVRVKQEFSPMVKGSYPFIPSGRSDVWLGGLWREAGSCIPFPHHSCLRMKEAHQGGLNQENLGGWETAPTPATALECSDT